MHAEPLLLVRASPARSPLGGVLSRGLTNGEKANRVLACGQRCPEEEDMMTTKFGRIARRVAVGVVLAVGIGSAAVSPAHADWYNGQWGHWGWRHGVRVFFVEPYPYGYY